ncbi:MAG: tRNA (pseudouridine(54)-N(1))-methyltransferase TrmY [Gammaproteobacteria bacterium]|nr:tRNA (pseudouridine(54)-N(1))-methyltransferase TrmY [Gammaproteobacteria bacterium]
MRTFIIRARKGTTRWERVRSQIGASGHFEVIAHSVINAFFVSNGFREDVEIYIILDCSEDFPRTIKLSAGEGLSIAGFYEDAVIDLVEKALKDSHGLQKDETRVIAPGLQISGFGFEKLVGNLLETRPVYLLDRKGEDIRNAKLDLNPVFVLSDHLAMPKNSVKSLKRQGVKAISFGKKMLFASQCVVLIHYELDRSEF